MNKHLIKNDYKNIFMVIFQSQFLPDKYTLILIKLVIDV